MAAEYIKTGGREACAGSKRRLLREVNELLSANDMPPADKLCELPGSFVDLAYTSAHRRARPSSACAAESWLTHRSY